MSVDVLRQRLGDLLDNKELEPAVAYLVDKLQWKGRITYYDLQNALNQLLPKKTPYELGQLAVQFSQRLGDMLRDVGYEPTYEWYLDAGKFIWERIRPLLGGGGQAVQYYIKVGEDKIPLGAAPPPPQGAGVLAVAVRHPQDLPRHKSNYSGWYADAFSIKCDDSGCYLEPRSDLREQVRRILPGGGAKFLSNAPEPPKPPWERLRDAVAQLGAPQLPAVSQGTPAEPPQPVAGADTRALATRPLPEIAPQPPTPKETYEYARPEEWARLGYVKPASVPQPSQPQAPPRRWPAPRPRKAVRLA